MSDVDYRHNARARVNRAVKAEQLADQIEELGRVPDRKERPALCRSAGFARASDETWSMAVEIYQERRR